MRLLSTTGIITLISLLGSSHGFSCHNSNQPLLDCGGGQKLALVNCLNLCKCGGPESGVGLACFNLDNCSSETVLETCASAFGCTC